MEFQVWNFGRPSDQVWNCGKIPISQPGQPNTALMCLEDQVAHYCRYRVLARSEAPPARDLLNGMARSVARRIEHADCNNSELMVLDQLRNFSDGIRDGVAQDVSGQEAIR